MARIRQFVQRGDATTVIRPGSADQFIVSINLLIQGSTGNNAGIRYVSGEITGITIGAGGSGYTAAATKAYAEGDGKRIELGDVTVAAGAVTAIAIPDDNSQYGFSEAPTITIEGDGNGATATATVTRRTYTIRQATNTVREGTRVMATRDWWLEIYADDADDAVIMYAQELP